MIALIDGDVVTYACGFAAEVTEYELTVESEVHVFRYKKEVDEWLKENPVEGYHLEVVKKIPPLSHALHNARQLITNVLERVKASDVHVYLTGKSNFRDKVATIRGYKAHRDKAAKPVHYKEIQQYLIDTWKAEVVEGMEADDAMAIKQMKHYDALDDYTCICTIDKDLDQVPGWHYNWDKDNLYKIDRDQAIRYYVKQMLTGDSTDNILGVPGIGPKSAEKLMEGIATDDLHSMLMDVYKTKFTPEFKKKYDIPENMTWEEIYNETDKLIRIKWTVDD